MSFNDGDYSTPCQVMIKLILNYIIIIELYLFLQVIVLNVKNLQDKHVMQLKHEDDIPFVDMGKNVLLFSYILFELQDLIAKGVGWSPTHWILEFKIFK